MEEKVIANGLAYLNECRAPGVGYRYGTCQTLEGPWKSYDTKEKTERSAGRVVLCEWMLYRHDKAKQQDLRNAMERFMNNRKFLWDMRAVRKSDNVPKERQLTASNSPYSGFLFYSCRSAAFALADLPKDDQKVWAKTLLAELRNEMGEDGFWAQLPEKSEALDTGLGDNCYATACVLLTLKELNAMQ